jgi:thioesterase domain-containing protein
LIAYEMARQLSAAGEAPGLIVMIDAPRPDLDTRPLPTEADVLADAMPMFGLAQADAHPQTLTELIEAAQALGLVPEEFGLADAERLLAVSLATALATRAYRPEPSIARALQLRALRRDEPPPDWTELLADAPPTLDLDGSHTELMDSPLAARIAVFVSPHLL